MVANNNRKVLAAIAVPLALIAIHPGHASPAPVTGAVATTAAPTRFTVEVVGKGPPLILIPGLSSPRAVWDGVTPELARTHRVIRVQINGFGGEAAGDNINPGALDAIVAELANYIRREQLERPAVVGHSLGGLLGMMLASRHPDAVGRLLVVDSLPFFSTLMMPDATVAKAEPRAAEMRDMLLARAGAMAATGPVTADPGGNMSITAEGRIQVANWSLKADPKAVAQLMYEVMTTDIRPELARIAARPFTILYAAGMGEAQAKAIWEPQYAGSPATLVAIPGGYHFIMVDQPAAFRRELTRFLSN